MWVLDTPKWNLPNECLSEAAGSRRAGGLPPPLRGREPQPSPRASGLRGVTGTLIVF